MKLTRPQHLNVLRMAVDMAISSVPGDPHGVLRVYHDKLLEIITEIEADEIDEDAVQAARDAVDRSPLEPLPIPQPAPAPASKRPAKSSKVQLEPLFVDNEYFCPKCGAKAWDNRANRKNPRAPLFRCSSESCDYRRWP